MLCGICGIHLCSNLVHACSSKMSLSHITFGLHKELVNIDESLFSFRHTCLHSTYKGKYKLHTTYILSMYVLHKYLFSNIHISYLEKKLFLVISAVIDRYSI